jgi:hypothetical protein
MKNKLVVFVIFFLLVSASSVSAEYLYEPLHVGKNIVIYEVNSDWRTTDVGDYHDNETLRTLTILRDVYDVQWLQVKHDYYFNGVKCSWNFESQVYYPQGYTWRYLPIPDLNIGIPRSGNWKVVVSVRTDGGSYEVREEKCISVANGQGKVTFIKDMNPGLYTSKRMRTSPTSPFDWIPAGISDSFTIKQPIFVSLLCGDIGIDTDYQIVYYLYREGTPADSRTVPVSSSSYKDKMNPWAQFGPQGYAGTYQIRAFMVKDGKETLIKEVSIKIK